MQHRSVALRCAALCLSLVVGGTGCATRANRNVKPAPISQKTPSTPPKSQAQVLKDYVTGGVTAHLPLNFLVLGLDASKQRSDVILAVSVPTKGAVTITSIPRDTRVYISGKGYAKVNQAYAHGGAAATATAVKGLLGKSFPYHVTLTFDGLKRLVDSLGGVPMTIDQPMRYTDKAGGLYIDIKPGTQVLKGSQAVHYVRYRADGKGDIGRIKRQQVFLSSWAQALTKQPTRLLMLRKGLPSGVTSNLRLDETLRLAARFALAKQEIKFSVLPGHADYVSRVSYWIPTKVQKPIAQPVRTSAGAAR